MLIIVDELINLRSKQCIIVSIRKMRRACKKVQSWESNACVVYLLSELVKFVINFIDNQIRYSRPNSASSLKNRRQSNIVKQQSEINYKPASKRIKWYKTEVNKCTGGKNRKITVRSSQEDHVGERSGINEVAA